MNYQYTDTIQCYHLTVTAVWCKLSDIELFNVDTQRCIVKSIYFYVVS